MSIRDKEENPEEVQEEALSEAEAPGEVLDPLAEPIGSRGTQTKAWTEFDEEDARERPPEDGVDEEVPDDEKLSVVDPQNFEDELDGDLQVGGSSDDIIDDETKDVTEEESE